MIITTGLLILIQIINLYLVESSLLSINSGFVRFFDLNKEKNAPALFSTFGLFLSGAALFTTAFQEYRLKRFSWFTLGIIFLLLSYDELFSFHEDLIKPVRNYLNVSGYLYFAWVIPYGIATAILAVLFYKFLKALPHKTKWLMVLSGFIYVLGALGFELLGGKQYVSDGEVQTITFRILYTIEESLEMIAIILFLNTIIDYLKNITAAQNKPVPVIEIQQNQTIIDERENDYRRTGTL